MYAFAGPLRINSTISLTKRVQKLLFTYVQEYHKALDLFGDWKNYESVHKQEVDGFDVTASSLYCQLMLMYKDELGDSDKALELFKECLSSGWWTATLSYFWGYFPSAAQFDIVQAIYEKEKKFDAFLETFILRLVTTALR